MNDCDQFKNLNAVYLESLVISKAGIFMVVATERGALFLNLKEETTINLLCKIVTKCNRGSKVLSYSASLNPCFEMHAKLFFIAFNGQWANVFTHKLMLITLHRCP